MVARGFSQSFQQQLLSSRWTHHSGRINSLSWTADSAHLASGSLDTHVYVWSVAKLMRNIAIRNAGPGGINGVLWLDGGKGPTGRLATTGFDGVMRVWEVKFHV
jgi:WD40 repeat protein